MGIDLGDIRELYAGLYQQLVMDTQAGGADDGEVLALYQIVDRADGAVGAVFNGHHAEFAKTGFHSGEHRLKALDIDNFAPGQQAVAGYLGIGALHALAGNKARLGKDLSAGSERLSHLGGDLSGGIDQLRLTGSGQFKKRGEEVVGIAFLVPGLFRDLGQNLPFPLLVENGQVMLVFISGDLFRKAHPL